MHTHPGYYLNLCNHFDEMVEGFNKVIQLDLKRTGGHFINDTQRETMRRILSSYAKRNFDIAYCQGFNFVCYFLFQLNFEEEQIFWMICKIFDQIMPPNYYVQMIPAIADIEFFNCLFTQKEPHLSAIFIKKGIDLNFVLIPNFITLFTNVDNQSVC